LAKEAAGRRHAGRRLEKPLEDTRGEKHVAPLRAYEQVALLWVLVGIGRLPKLLGGSLLLLQRLFVAEQRGRRGWCGRRGGCGRRAAGGLFIEGELFFLLRLG